MRVGIMGGTFCPIHNVHLTIAQFAMDEFMLDKVLFVTSGNPPHKRDIKIVNAQARHRMVELATEDNKKFEPCDYEVERNGYSYTATTLLHFKEKYPDDELFFIIGADSLVHFSEWYMPEKIAELCTLLVFNRAGCTDDIDRFIEQTRMQYQAKVYKIHAPLFDLSSSIIREQVRQGHSIRYLVPPKVEEFITSGGWFKEPVDRKERLREMLTEKQFRHSMNVSKMAIKLAQHYGEDSDRAYMAGILHDCAKNIPGYEMPKRCDELNVALSDIEKTSPSLIHAPLGAKIAEVEFDVDDEQILNAIRYHTVGRAHMTMLEKIVYLADIIEPLRKFPGVDELRTLAFENIDRAMICAFDSSLLFNIKKEVLLHPNTIEARNFLLMQVDKK